MPGTILPGDTANAAESLTWFPDALFNTTLPTATNGCASSHHTQVGSNGQLMPVPLFRVASSNVICCTDMVHDGHSPRSMAPIKSLAAVERVDAPRTMLRPLRPLRPPTNGGGQSRDPVLRPLVNLGMTQLIYSSPTVGISSQNTMTWTPKLMNPVYKHY